MFKNYLEKISDNENLTRKEAADALECIIREEPSATEIGAFLVGLRVKGEAVEELSGFVDTMEKHMVRVDLQDKNAIDVCGTGGDGKHSFNVSTTVGFVAAAAGIPVAKHGNRSVSSKSGSADVLEHLGAKIDLTPEYTKRCVDEIGIGFFFAPLYHPAMKVIVPHRKSLGIRTFFNMLGPLLNPAAVKRQLIGTFNLEAAQKIAEVLQMRGSVKACTVYSSDGFDEVSPFDFSHVFEVDASKNGITEHQFNPPEFENASQKIAGGESAENVEIIKKVLSGKKGSEYQIISLNAGFSIYVGGKADSIEQGIVMAKELIDKGAAMKKMNEYIEFTNKI
ncbi:MAG: anthranilate phosphoribosyltransferase [Calditrichaceae bacterium]